MENIIRNGYKHTHKFIYFRSFVLESKESGRKMEWLSAEKTRQRMNDYGAKGIPFLCAVNYELTEGFVLPYPLEQKEVWWNMEGITNQPSFTTEKQGSYFRSLPMDEDSYAAKFRIARQGLLRGDSFLLNLTVATDLDTDFTLEEIFIRSKARYKLLVPDRFVCFSPETFVILSDGKISSFPMKGTIRADIPNADHIILNDYKESAEHHTIVDLIRNDLNRVATDVRVERFRYIDRLVTNRGEILQVSSQVTGNLPEDYLSRLGDLIFDMLPAGSISGAPKAATVRIIREAEKEDRGFYTGIFGYFDGKSFRSAVMIRFIEQQGNRLRFRSGGGITVNSDCSAEYQEVLQKVYLPC